MISSAIWNKRAGINYLKDRLVGRVQIVIIKKKVISVNLFQIVREKSCDHLFKVYKSEKMRGSL